MMPPRRAVIKFARWLAADARRLEELSCFFDPRQHLEELAEHWYDTLRAVETARPVSPETVAEVKAALASLCPTCHGAGVVAETQAPIPFYLGAALKEYVEGLGLILGGWERQNWHSISVCFGKGMDFLSVSAGAISDRSLYPNTDTLDRAIFEVAQIAVDGMAHVEGWVE
jgi:hypothetical protein